MATYDPTNIDDDSLIYMSEVKGIRKKSSKGIDVELVDKSGLEDSSEPQDSQKYDSQTNSYSQSYSQSQSQSVTPSHVTPVTNSITPSRVTPNSRGVSENINSAGSFEMSEEDSRQSDKLNQ